jgi:hypothetical protein
MRRSRTSVALPARDENRTAFASPHLPVICTVARRRIAKMPRRVFNGLAMSIHTVLCAVVAATGIRSRRMEPPATKWRLTSYVNMQLLAWRGHRACIHATCERLLADSSTCIHDPITHFTANRCFRQVDAGPGKRRGEPAENCRIGLPTSRRPPPLAIISDARMSHRHGQALHLSVRLCPVPQKDVARACAQLQSSTVVSSLPSP